MDRIQLQKFCCEDVTKINITAPWSEGDKTFATNGHLLIIVPRLADVGEIEKPIKLDDKLKVTLVSEPEKWFPIPPLGAVAQEPCKDCKGTGKAYTCPECDGEGQVCPETSFNTYDDQECMSCEGVGTLTEEKWLKLTKRHFNKDATTKDAECETCFGTGKNLLHNPVEIGHCNFSDLYLSWLAELPNCMTGTFDEYAPGRIKFDGGEGLIMPKRKG